MLVPRSARTMDQVVSATGIEKPREEPWGARRAKNGGGSFFQFVQFPRGGRGSRARWTFQLSLELSMWDTLLRVPSSEGYSPNAQQFIDSRVQGLILRWSGRVYMSR